MASARRPRHHCLLVCLAFVLVGFAAGYFFYRFVALSMRLDELRQTLDSLDPKVKRQFYGEAKRTMASWGGKRTEEEGFTQEDALLLWKNASKEGGGGVESIGSAALRNELKKTAAHARAAFDKVVTLSSLLPGLKEIPRMRTSSPSFFRDYIAPVGLPVVFTDMLEGTKLSRWTWDYVRSKWGKTAYLNTRQGDYSTKTSKNGKHLVNRVTVTLDDFIDVATGKRELRKRERNMYIAKKRLIPVEALEKEFYYPPFYPGNYKKCYLEPTGWYVLSLSLFLSLRVY